MEATMHRLLRHVPLIAAGAVLAALVYVGAALFSRTANDLAWARRDAFAQSVYAGERVVAAHNMAGVLRIELNAERARNQRDWRLAILAAGAALILLVGVGVQVLTDRRWGRGPREEAAA